MMAATPEQAAAGLVALYRTILDRHGRELAAAMASIARDTPAAFGCAAGKDRTGLVAALVHELLGVEEEDLVASYASSPPAVERLRPLVADYFPDDVEIPNLEVLLGAEQRTMRETLAYLRSRYGGVESYLMRNGLPRMAVQRLREQLLY
jgi:protein-tyrosine phosphatase